MDNVPNPHPQDMLNRKLDKEKFASTALFFTKITTPRTVQVRIFMGCICFHLISSLIVRTSS